MKKTAVICWVVIAVMAGCALAQAQEAPPPRRMPRVPVSREAIVDRHDAAPPTHVVQGAATIVDGEKLRVGDTDLRLFGIVPPQLAASFGPQARAALDALATGQTVVCAIRDRDRDGRLLATCRTAGGVDLALDLLKRGLAVTARGSLLGTELDGSYLGAEQAAQAQKIGLWSIAVPIAAAAPPQETPGAPAAIAKEEKLQTRPVEKASAAQPDRTQASATQAAITADILDQHAQAHPDETLTDQDDEAGFFERYQILIAGLLMIGTALGIIAALWRQKRRDKDDETRSVAAALRGELMAARGVCLGRVRNISDEDEDKAAVWPRIRATLYGAYVGRLGLLGAELARQVASIYGQASDYAALYAPGAAAIHATPKKHALETLIRNIDEVLPKLVVIERTGSSAAAASFYRRRAQGEAAARPTAGASAAPVSFAAPEPVAGENYAPVTQVPPHFDPPSGQGARPREARASAALWESVRDFIQNRRNAITQPVPPAYPHEAEVSEYAAMIEAEMARYPYGDSAETFDISPRKKPKSSTGS